MSRISATKKLILTCLCKPYLNMYLFDSVDFFDSLVENSKFLLEYSYKCEVNFVFLVRISIVRSEV